ncbi:MAG: T9SS type A sorting domain-containing protein, partial [Candidatus Marinimicrobia bacterium]|nr:T9SS type A sorting domain-containing protein [Candidatus Neomarinimicrobiota bacterium]
ATNPDPQHLEIAVNQMKNLSWMPGVRSPNGYKISLWYVDGSNHYVCSDKDINNNLSYNPSDDGVDSLEYFTTYYWQVTPYSSVGDATSIPTWEFQTEAINDLSSYPTNSSNKSVDLFWNMSDKDTLKKIIYAKAFGDYPEYDDGTGSSPTIPTDTTTAIANSWTKIYSGSDTSYTHQTTERDYFYYASFIKYLQNDYCGEVESDSSLSYWLGDFNSDSSVLASDIAKLSVAFGTSDGDVDYVDSLDIGPTADSSRFALPLTDNVIDFEDLMIISMNYENTIYNNLIFDNNGMYQPMLYKNTYDDNNMIQIRMEASFNEDELVAKLYLKNNLGNLKGLKIPIKFSANLQVNHVTRGNIWEGTDFFIGKKSSNSIKIVGSAMGTDNAIHNNGEIATIYFDISGNHEMIDINFDEINTRSIENNEIKKEADIDLVPGVYFLSQNYPNPFNSSTQIKFAVREEGTVRINIYNIKGQLIKKLVNKEYRPNIYSVEWNAVNEFGKQVATGLYIYRIQINDYMKSKKMILLK